MNSILPMLVMFASQLGTQEKAYLAPLCVSWVNLELNRIGLIKTPDQIAGFVDFALDVIVAEEIFDAKTLMNKVSSK